MGWVGNGGVDINIIIATEVLFHPLSLCWVLWRITIKKLSITKTLHYKIINLQYAVKPLVSNDPNAKTFWLHTHCTRGGYWWESNHRSLFQEKVLRHLRFWTVDGLWELVTYERLSFKFVFYWCLSQIFTRNLNTLTLFHQLCMLAILKRVKKGTEKKLFHNSQTLLTLDSFSKCNIIKVSTKTEIIKCDVSEEWLNGYFLDFKKQNTLVWSGCSLRKQLTFGNATTGFPPNDIWETSSEIPYCNASLPRSGLCLILIGCATWEIWFNQSEELPRSG